MLGAPPVRIQLSIPRPPAAHVSHSGSAQVRAHPSGASAAQRVAAESAGDSSQRAGGAPVRILRLVRPSHFFRFVLVLNTSSVANGTWTGGNATYSDLNEGGSYWFDGLVATAFVTGDARLKSQVQSFLDYIIDHQGMLLPSRPSQTN